MTEVRRAAQPSATAASPAVTEEMCTEETCTDGCCASPTSPPQQGRGGAWTRAASRARALSWVSLIWMTAEGLAGLIAGVGAQSISLVGWALGSAIEGLASVVVIWRFTGARTLSADAEGRAQKAVAVSFFLLAPYLAVEAVRDLTTGHHASSSGLGVVITAASLVVMPLLGIAKQRLGRTLGSGATAGEGLQNLLCAAQAGAVLLGIAATATLGWTWADPAVALLLAAWAVKEGIAAWHGDDCC